MHVDAQHAGLLRHKAFLREACWALWISSGSDVVNVLEDLEDKAREVAHSSLSSRHHRHRLLASRRLRDACAPASQGGVLCPSQTTSQNIRSCACVWRQSVDASAAPGTPAMAPRAGFFAFALGPVRWPASPQRQCGMRWTGGPGVSASGAPGAVRPSPEAIANIHSPHANVMLISPGTPPEKSAI
jgi:hypothetical protein